MASPAYLNEALVTLTAIDPPQSFPFPCRRIFLRKSNPTIRLGRTSKRNTAFAPTEDNGWFDSAVMSRDHAELVLDPQAQRVFIKDIGSLHGTFFNDTRLGQQQAQAIKDGDLLRFGIAIDRGSDTFPPCTMQTTIQFGTMSSIDGPAIFRVPDESDVELSAEEDNGIQSSSQVLRDNHIHPAQHHVASSTPIIAIDLTDQDETVQSPKLEFQTLPERQIQETGTREFIDLDFDGDDSERSQPRMPTPPITIEIEDEDTLFNDDEYSEGDISENDGDHLSSAGDFYGVVQDLPDDDDSASNVAQATAVAVHESEVVDRFENSCLPPILDYSNARTTSGPKPPPPNVRLPSLYETIRSPGIFTGLQSANGTCDEVTNANQSPNQAHFKVLEPDSPKIWEGKVACDLATQSSPLLASGAEFFYSQPKEHHKPEATPSSPVISESPAYQSEITKEAIDQQQLETVTACMSIAEPVESHEVVRNNKRKAAEISQVSDESRPLESPAFANSRVVALHSINERPMKRLHKAAEIFGYAALGGAAVMSALIATAPTL